MQQPVTALAPRPLRPLTHAERFAQLRDLHDRLRRTPDPTACAGGSSQQDLRARIAACEADLMEARFDNMPI